MFGLFAIPKGLYNLSSTAAIHEGEYMNRRGAIIKLAKGITKGTKSLEERISFEEAVKNPKMRQVYVTQEFKKMVNEELQTDLKHGIQVLNVNYTTNIRNTLTELFQRYVVKKDRTSIPKLKNIENLTSFYFNTFRNMGKKQQQTVYVFPPAFKGSEVELKISLYRATVIANEFYHGLNFSSDHLKLKDFNQKVLENLTRLKTTYRVLSYIEKHNYHPHLNSESYEKLILDHIHSYLYLKMAMSITKSEKEKKGIKLYLENFKYDENKNRPQMRSKRMLS